MMVVVVTLKQGSEMIWLMFLKDTLATVWRKH